MLMLTWNQKHAASLCVCVDSDAGFGVGQGHHGKQNKDKHV